MGHLGGDWGHGFRGCRDDGLARQCADVLCPTDCDVSTGLRCLSRRANCPGLSDVGACRHWLGFGVGAGGLCRSYTTGLRELSQPALTRNDEKRKTRPFLGRVFFWGSFAFGSVYYDGPFYFYQATAWARAHCFQSIFSAPTKRSISSSLCSGPGVKRNRSVPFGTVG